MLCVVKDNLERDADEELDPGLAKLMQPAGPSEQFVSDVFL